MGEIMKGVLGTVWRLVVIAAAFLIYAFSIYGATG